jgi:hyperosmotically inducible periplasmic protein
MKPLLYAAILSASVLAGCEDPNSGPSPSNTGRNARDRSGDTKTPMDQSNTARDTEITAAVRRGITDEPSMSVEGRNCKVITDGGVVTLRGVVSTQAEKETIDRIARETPGVTRVDNQLEIKAP